MQRIKHIRGITLIELLIVVLIFSILAMLAVPSIQQQRADLEKQRVLNDLISLVHLSKQEARLRQRPIVICSSSDGKVCSTYQWHEKLMIFSDANHNKTFDDTDQLISTVPMSLNFGTLHWNASLKKQYLQFKGDTGLPRGVIGNFIYCSQYDSNHFKLTLNMMGIVRHESILHC